LLAFHKRRYTLAGRSLLIEGLGPLPDNFRFSNYFAGCHCQIELSFLAHQGGKVVGKAALTKL
jgi:hypothetical protein